MKYNITYYLNTACRERRPETAEDIRNDWKEVEKEFESDLQAFEYMMTDCLQFDDEELEELYDDNGAESEIEKIEAIQEYIENQDPTEGSIILVSYAGPEAVFDFGFEIPEIEDEEMEDLLQDLISTLNSLSADDGLYWDENEIYDNCAITEDEESDQYMEVFVYKDKEGNVRYSTDEEHADNYETIQQVYDALIWKSY